jgi:hypothetical protein
MREGDNSKIHISSKVPIVYMSFNNVGHCITSTITTVTRLSSIALLGTSGRIFKCRRILILGRKMSDCKSEQVNIKFLVKLKKSTMETYGKLLTEANGEDCMSHACMFEWHK